ncbi:GvpL/GvpF family gas vesicle protein [Halococcus dombrowskii]|uniref:Gas vesicle protein GvpL n=1 Tax=Halococcus dombrowskii TaxID=179637 RepID=A0AAV3SCA7_HALDO|nr:GvpL/GvpF family gas vesicle protein [Halococcus dombrowskii]UOO96128.1 GvpL/GvpF family gas vesicle protein [Halococcus dombrowskii]
MADDTDTEFEEGRYLYCAVAVDDGADLDTEGVDDEPVRLLAVDDIGVVLHDCESLYDTANMDELRKWVLQHQNVVDAAGEVFGTPIPFQFDTVLTGDDDRVREWVGEERGTLADYLDQLAGHWEYRVELRREEEALREDLVASDDRLAELDEEIEAAGSGTAFMLEKQYDQRLRELRRERRGERAAALRDRLDEFARTVDELGERTTLDDEGGDDGMETQARFTVLATDDNEEEMGEMLDEVAAETGVEVRFTGPWPPYSFVPAIGGEDGTETGG